MEKEIQVKSATWFVASVSVIRQQEDGTEKRVKEQYAVDAESFTEAESKIYEELTGADLQLKDLTIAPFTEALTTEGDRFYKVKVNVITTDDNTGKEKKQPVYYLVQATSTADAQRNADHILKNSLLDYAVESIIETKILELFIND